MSKMNPSMIFAFGSRDSNDGLAAINVMKLLLWYFNKGVINKCLYESISKFTILSGIYYKRFFFYYDCFVCSQNHFNFAEIKFRIMTNRTNSLQTILDIRLRNVIGSVVGG